MKMYFLHFKIPFIFIIAISFKELYSQFFAQFIEFIQTTYPFIHNKLYIYMYFSGEEEL